MGFAKTEKSGAVTVDIAKLFAEPHVQMDLAAIELLYHKSGACKGDSECPWCRREYAELQAWVHIRNKR